MKINYFYSCVFIMCLLGCKKDVVQQSNILPATLNKILFTTSIQDGNTYPMNLYTINVDGTNMTQLTFFSDTSETFYTYNTRFGNWMIDGSKILFVSNKDSVSFADELYVMDTDDYTISRLSYNNTSEIYPTFSPDGNKILYTYNFNLYTMNIDGSNIQPLTYYTGNEYAYCGSYSPDGTKIVFIKSDDSIGEIFCMNFDGSNIIQITNSGYDKSSPEFSPDGERILFSSATTNFTEDVQLFVMDNDGSNITQLTDISYASSGIIFDKINYASWSPDGSKIIYNSRTDLGANWEINIMNSDGTGNLKLPNPNNLSRFMPRWR